MFSPLPDLTRPQRVRVGFSYQECRDEATAEWQGYASVGWGLPTPFGLLFCDDELEGGWSLAPNGTFQWVEFLRDGEED